jgi:hypothetical protein
MRQERIAVVGDAAFVPRPPTGASTSKVASNTIALGEALRRGCLRVASRGCGESIAQRSRKKEIGTEAGRGRVGDDTTPPILQYSTTPVSSAPGSHFARIALAKTREMRVGAVLVWNVVTA